MPILTRSKLHTNQSYYCTAFPGEVSKNFLRRLNLLQQGKPVMFDSAEVESLSLSESTPNSRHQVAGLRISESTSKRCLTCPKLITHKNFTSKHN